MFNQNIYTHILTLREEEATEMFLKYMKLSGFSEEEAKQILNRGINWEALVQDNKKDQEESGAFL